MIVPEFWAEGRAAGERDGHAITIRRFGWSDLGQDDAQRRADERAQEALQRALSGEELPRREPKVAYNGASGVPIREEIVARHGACVVTRNAYGALCLNTPDVLIVDIDFATRAASAQGMLLPLAAGTVAGLLTWRLTQSVFGGLAVFMLVPVLLQWVRSALRRASTAAQGGVEHVALDAIRAYVQRHPESHYRVYRTPAGLRAMAVHRSFDPLDPQVQECFEAMGADPIYARMCRNQHCFRARVSAKPWRIGIADHLRPRPGVWPISADRMPERRAWIAAYDERARNYSACRYLTSIGEGRIDPQAERVCSLHDELCGAQDARPIA